MLHFMLMALVNMISYIQRVVSQEVVFHFLKNHPVLGDVRVITNVPSIKELPLYGASEANRAPVDDVYAINAGNQVHALIIKRLVEKHVPFRLTVVENKVLNPEPNASTAQWQAFHNQWTSLVDQANFAWANASSTFLLQFPGLEGWTLAPIGLELLDSPKASKRANEIVRSSAMWRYTEKVKLVRTKVVQPDIDPIATDGMSYISLSFALSMVHDAQTREGIISGKIRRVNFRMVFPEGYLAEMPQGGLIKGDACIMPNQALDGYHVVTVQENLKSELRATEQFLMATCFHHHTTHEATWDIQRLIMNPQILTHEHRARDLARLITASKDAVTNGEIPEWLLLSGNETFDDDGLGSVRADYSDIDSIPLRWQAAGFDVRAAQNVVRMAFNTVTNRMAKFFDKGFLNGNAMGYAKAMWLPKSNALVALINTHGSLTRVGGYRTQRSGETSYFVKKFGLILPDSRMVELYPLIGGGDLDDSVELQLIKLWSSDPGITDMMRKNGVISAEEDIPTSIDEAKYCASVLRSPNGAGEFSFIEIEDILDLPWQFLDIDHVELIDLASLPLPQAEMLAQVRVGGIAPSVTYSKLPFTQDNAVRQIVAQQSNPGIGQAANTMMAWAGVAGPSMPPVIAAPFEQLVDGTQQMADPAIFAAVKATARMASASAIAVLKAGGEVDSYLVRRFAGASDKRIASNHSFHGPLAQFQEKYREAIKELHEAIVQQSFQMREEQELVKWVRDLNFDAEAILWANQFVSKHSGKLAQIDREYSGTKLLRGIRKITAQRDKSQQIRETIDTMLAELEAYSRPGQRALAMWHSILTPTGRMPFGSGDRLIFQPGSDGRAVMDLLIPVLHERGWGVPLS